MLLLKRSALSALALACVVGPSSPAQQPTPPISLDTSSIGSSSSRASLPDAPSEVRSMRPVVAGRKAPVVPVGALGYPFRGNVSCGSGASLQAGAPQSAVAMCGFGFTFLPFVQTEFGGIGPQGGFARFYISADGYVPLAPLANRLHGEPIAIFGYTKMFYNSNDLDFGLAWDHHLSEEASLVYELRDYVQFGTQVQHTVMFRVNLVGGGDD